MGVKCCISILVDLDRKLVTPEPAGEGMEQQALMSMKKELTLGVLSDTHGLLRPEAIDALQGVSQILHAGDLGSEQVLHQLVTIAPVLAVRGNVDTGSWATQLPFTASQTIGREAFFVIHNLNDLPSHPAPPGTQVIVYGHSHKPSQVERDGILYLNPGSAGPGRFSLPVTLALGHQDAGHWVFSFLKLAVSR